jgi:hypothetical protein
VFVRVLHNPHLVQDATRVRKSSQAAARLALPVPPSAPVTPFSDCPTFSKRHQPFAMFENIKA